MCAFDPFSGNVSGQKNTRRSVKTDRRALVKIQVQTRVEDGLLLPNRILLPDGKEIFVLRVYGCERDPARQNAMRYGIRIGGRTASVWMREDKIWLIERTMLNRLLQQL